MPNQSRAEKKKKNALDAHAKALNSPNILFELRAENDCAYKIKYAANARL